MFISSHTVAFGEAAAIKEEGKSFYTMVCGLARTNKRYPAASFKNLHTRENKRARGCQKRKESIVSRQTSTLLRCHTITPLSKSLFSPSTFLLFSSCFFFSRLLAFFFHTAQKSFAFDNEILVTLSDFYVFTYLSSFFPSSSYSRVASSSLFTLCDR